VSQAGSPLEMSTDDKAACMVLSDEGFVMLLSEPFFRIFTRRQLCDTRSHTDGLFALSCDSRSEVDEPVNKASRPAARTRWIPKTTVSCMVRASTTSMAITGDPVDGSRRSSRLRGMISPSYRKEESNGEEALATHSDIEEDGSAQRIKSTLSQGRNETCADTWSLRLDHAHGAGQLESRSDKGVVHGRCTNISCNCD
jgi:hypothetical protein